MDSKLNIREELKNLPTDIYNEIFKSDKKSDEWILCSAIKRNSPRKSQFKSLPYWEGTNDIMDIELGYRHHDIFNRFGNEVSRNPKDQGFYTSKGRFVNREEGMKIAFESGQVDQFTAFCRPTEHDFILHITEGIELPDIKYNKLTSEDLY